jgi:hypothetical protein
MNGTRTVVRVNGSNPNSHLWDNNGTWWVHYTLHLPDYTKRRVRQSLHTGDLEEARRRRNELFHRLGVGGGDAAADVLPRAAYMEACIDNRS